MKDLIYRKLIKYFVLFSPIIDIITSYMYYHNYKITIGLVLKGIILLFAIVYLIFIDKEKRKKNILYLSIISLCLIVNINNSLDVIKITMLSYFTYMFKYFYYCVMLLFFFRWYKEYDIKLSELRIPIIIISIMTILSVVTNTAYFSYQYNPYKAGISMWYSSANELGNILCLLFPVCIYNAFHNKDGIKLDLYLIPIIGASLLLLGTKVGLLGYFIIILFYLIIRLILVKVMKLDMRFLIMVLLLIIPLSFGKNLPGVHNIIISMEVDEGTLLSGRDVFLKRIIEERKDTNLSSKIFGKSYYGELKRSEGIMLVEQDFIDVFFMYGYVGIIIVLLPIIYLYYHFFSFYWKLYKNNNKISKKGLATMLAITICMMVSFISGHAILSPSVSIFLVLLIALLINIKFNNNDKSKTFVLISDTINSDKLSSKYKVEVLENNKVFKNRFLSYLSVKSAKYDYIIENDNDSVYIKTYLKYSNGKHINYKDLDK